MPLVTKCIHLVGIYIFKSKVKEWDLRNVELGITNTKRIDEKEGQNELFWVVCI